MSFVAKKKGSRESRKRREKVLHTRIYYSRTLKSRMWKLKYPDIFERINEFPFIVRKK